MWGEDKQSHYTQGRTIREILRSSIEARCVCGYLTLKPNGEFEGFNGGLTVKRSAVRIIDDKTGEVVQRLRSRLVEDRYGREHDDIMYHYQCNACGNDWK